MEIVETDGGLSLEFRMDPGLSLHSRPSARLAQTARQFSSEIYLITENGEADAKSMLDILSLAPEPNARMKLLARGEDARDALMALHALMVRQEENGSRDS